MADTVAKPIAAAVKMLLTHKVLNPPRSLCRNDVESLHLSRPNPCIVLQDVDGTAFFSQAVLTFLTLLVFRPPTIFYCISCIHLGVDRPALHFANIFCMLWPACF